MDVTFGDDIPPVLMRSNNFKTSVQIVTLLGLELNSCLQKKIMYKSNPTKRGIHIIPNNERKCALIHIVFNTSLQT